MDTPPLPGRKTIRLQNYDYSQNCAYFVTICTAHKRPLFGVVRRGDPCGRPPVPVLLIILMCIWRPMSLCRTTFT